jgi:hypothetical protein
MKRGFPKFARKVIGRKEVARMELAHNTLEVKELASRENEDKSRVRYLEKIIREMQYDWKLRDLQEAEENDKKEQYDIA